MSNACGDAKLGKQGWGCSKEEVEYRKRIFGEQPQLVTFASLLASTAEYPFPDRQKLESLERAVEELRDWCTDKGIFGEVAAAKLTAMLGERT